MQTLFLIVKWMGGIFKFDCGWSAANKWNLVSVHLICSARPSEKNGFIEVF